MFRRHRRRIRDAVASDEAAATATPSPVVVIDDARFLEQTAGRVTDRISLTRIHWRTTRADVEASVSR